MIKSSSQQFNNVYRILKVLSNQDYLAVNQDNQHCLFCQSLSQEKVETYVKKCEQHCGLKTQKYILQHQQSIQVDGLNYLIFYLPSEDVLCIKDIDKRRILKDGLVFSIYKISVVNILAQLLWIGYSNIKEVLNIKNLIVVNKQPYLLIVPRNQPQNFITKSQLNKKNKGLIQIIDKELTLIKKFSTIVYQGLSLYNYSPNQENDLDFVMSQLKMMMNKQVTYEFVCNLLKKRQNQRQCKQEQKINQRVHHSFKKSNIQQNTLFKRRYTVDNRNIFQNASLRKVSHSQSIRDKYHTDYKQTKIDKNSLLKREVLPQRKNSKIVLSKNYHALFKPKTKSVFSTLQYNLFESRKTKTNMNTIQHIQNSNHKSEIVKLQAKKKFQDTFNNHKAQQQTINEQHLKNRIVKKLKAIKHDNANNSLTSMEYLKNRSHYSEDQKTKRKYSSAMRKYQKVEEIDQNLSVERKSIKKISNEDKNNQHIGQVQIKSSNQFEVQSSHLIKQVKTDKVNYHQPLKQVKTQVSDHRVIEDKIKNNDFVTEPAKQIANFSPLTENDSQLFIAYKNTDIFKHIQQLPAVQQLPIRTVQKQPVKATVQTVKTNQLQNNLKDIPNQQQTQNSKENTKKLQFYDEIQQITLLPKKELSSKPKQQLPRMPQLKQEQKVTPRQEPKQEPPAFKLEKPKILMNEQPKIEIIKYNSPSNIQLKIQKLNIQIQKFVTMINLLGDVVVRTLKIRKKLKKVKCLKAAYFIYQRFCHQRQKLLRQLKNNGHKIVRHTIKQQQQIFIAWHQTPHKQQLIKTLQNEQTSILQSLKKISALLLKQQTIQSHIDYFLKNRQKILTSSDPKLRFRLSQLAAVTIIDIYDTIIDQKITDENTSQVAIDFIISLKIIAQLDGLLSNQQQFFIDIYNNKKLKLKEIGQFTDTIYDLYYPEDNPQS